MEAASYEALSSELGSTIADIREALGSANFHNLIDDAFVLSAANLEVGTKILRERILLDHASKLGHGVTSHGNNKKQ